MTRKSKTDIIKETAEFYNLKNRGYDAESGQCLYYDHKTGCMCPVGRCMIDAKSFDFEGSIKSFIEDNCYEDFNILLKPEYRGHTSVHFWQDIQNFHDVKSYWTEEGLSEKGYDAYNMLLKRWS